MKVLKFGGTSVGTTESLRNVKSIVEGIDCDIIIVVSALGGLTDHLIATAKSAASGNSDYMEELPKMRTRHHEIIDKLCPRDLTTFIKDKINSLFESLEDIYRGVFLIKDLPIKTLDTIVSFGERMSSIIVSAIIPGATHLESLDVIKTEKWFDKNIADRVLTANLIRENILSSNCGRIVMGGFISRDRDTNEITNLGRGGSDYTAALVAAALDAEELQIWTDVDGFMTSDPRIIKSAHVIPEMSFIESMELCSFGAKVIYPPTIYPVFHKNIPIRILNTHNPQAPGTLISDLSKNLSKEIRGISVVRSTSMISIIGDLAMNVAEINSRTYNAMAKHGISVYLISQPDVEVKFSVAMNTAEVDKGVKALEEEFAPELQKGTINEIKKIDELSIIAVVRENIRELKGLGPRLLNTLQRKAIEVRAMSEGASETTLTIVVNSNDANYAMELIHGACFE